MLIRKCAFVNQVHLITRVYYNYKVHVDCGNYSSSQWDLHWSASGWDSRRVHVHAKSQQGSVCFC